MKTLTTINKALSKYSACLAALLFISSIAGTVSAQTKEKKKVKPFEVGIGLSGAYDNNILKYSDKYLERFMNNEDEGRFHIKTYDDIIVKPSLQIAYSFNVFKKQKSKINLSANYSSYVLNDVKNWSFFTAGFQQNFAKKASVRIYYSYVPEFYVRHFRDSDRTEVYGYIPETFVPFSFSKDDYGIWVQNTFFKNTRVRLSLNYNQYFHNTHFTEYDCDNFVYGILINQPVTKKLKVEFSYEFTTSDAKATDADPELDADADNECDLFALDIAWQLPAVLKLKHELSAGADFSKRYYITNNYIEWDPEHAGRVDNVLNLQVNYNVKLTKALELNAFFKWFGRDSRTTSDKNSEYVSEEKDYTQYQVGLELDYGFKF
jgi:hypothetical protein